MNDTEYQFLIIENALRNIKQSYRTMPGRIEKSIKDIRESLDWIERHHAPTGISECYLKQLRETTIYVKAVKDKSSALAFQIHNVIKEHGGLSLLGIQISFKTSDVGTPGMTFLGSRKKPTTLRVALIPTILPSDYKSIKKFISWVAEHQISSKELSEIVENFAVIDLATVEMKELGLGEEDRPGLNSEKIQEMKQKQQSATTSPPATESTGSGIATTPPVKKPDVTGLQPLSPPVPVKKKDLEYPAGFTGNYKVPNFVRQLDLFQQEENEVNYPGKYF